MHHPPSKRALGHQQVRNHVVLRAQVIRLGLDWWAFDNSPSRMFLQPRQHRRASRRLSNPAAWSKSYRKPSPPVQEEQQSPPARWSFLPSVISRATRMYQIAQSHHECAGDDNAHLQTPPHQIKGGGQAVCQEGIRQPLTWKDGVIRRELCVFQGGNEGQVHGEVAIGALTHVIGAVRRDADGMGILQISGEHGQRQHKQNCSPRPS